MNFAAQFSDEDFRRTMLSAIRLLAILAVILAVIIGWKMGWQSAGLLLVGAAIAAAGLWEWLRLMTAVMVRMDASQNATEGDSNPQKVRPLGMVLVNFFLRLGLTVVVLYVSLKLLHGSVYALAGGLFLGVFALSIEGIRLMKAWTV
jgi:VanZ family protein